MPNITKLSNVIGAAFRPFVVKQLKKRVERGITGQGTTNPLRTADEVLYLANQMAWIRLCSSVKVEQSYLTLLKEQFGKYGDSDAFLSSWTPTGLAQEWVLQSGTSKLDTSYPDSPEVTLRSGIGTDGAYGLGGIRTQGYRPMPGITSAEIESAGRLGSLRYATVNFKVWNRNQLDVIDALYLRLGYTMLLEWGHVQYFENNDTSNTLITDINGIDGWFDDNVYKEDIQYKINEKVASTQGNYDGMLGVVCNFDYSYNQDGGWDCSIKLIGLGSIMESQKINSLYNMPPGIASALKEARKKIDAAKREKIKAERDKINAETLKKANDQYATEIATYNKQHPIRDLETLYSNLTNGQKYTGTDEQKDLLISNAIFSTNEYPKYPYSTSNTVVATPDYSNLGYLDKASEIRPVWIKEGPAGLSTGYEYPLKQNNTYQLYDGAVDDIIINSYEYDFIDAMVGTAGNASNSFKKTSQTLSPITRVFLTALDLSTRKVIAFDKGTLSGGISAAPGRGVVGTTNNEDLQIEYVTNYIVDFENTTYTQTVGSQGILGNTTSGHYFILSLEAKQDAALKAAKSRGCYAVSREEWINFLSNDFDKALSDPATGWRVANWKLTGLSVRSLGDSAKRSGTTIASGKAHYAEIALEAEFTIPTLLKDPKNSSQTQSTNVTYVVTIKTDLPTILRKLISAPNIKNKPTPPDPKDPNFNAQPDYSGLDTNQNNQADGIASALEAMLTVIKYDGLSNADKSKLVVERSTVDLTGQFFNDATGSRPPMAPLYKQDAKKKYVLDIVTSADRNKTSAYDQIKTLPPEELLKNPFSLGIKGYNTALMQSYDLYDSKGTIQSQKDLWEGIPSIDFEKLHKSYTVNKYLLQSSQNEPTMDSEAQVYIPLGYLLYFLNNQCLLYDTTKGSGAVGGANLARPIIYIDHNPETNLCFTMPSQLSIDPGVALIPYVGTSNDYGSLFINGITADTPFDPSKQNVISKSLPEFRNETAYQGKVLNILINTEYLLSIIKSTVDTDSHNNIYLQQFLERVVTDVNKALGGVNAFRVGYNDAANTVTILDDQYVTTLTGEASSNVLEGDILKDLTNTDGGYFQIPVYEQISIARSLSIQTDTSTRMSRAIAIGAQAQNSGSVQSSDSSAYHWLNHDLVDRIIVTKDNPSQPKQAKQTKTPPDKEDPNKVLANKFNQHVINIYSDKQNIYREVVDPSKNFLIQGATKQKAEDPKSYGTLALPINTQLTLTGISGVMMGNAFLLPDKILPITIRGTDAETKFGFCVMGLSHTIDSNQWTTSIKGNMIKLRKTREIGNAAGPQAVGNTATTNNTAGGCNNIPDVVNTRIIQGTADWPNACHFTVQSGKHLDITMFKQLYPNYTFRNKTSDINLSKAGLSPLTGTEIVDKTNQNLFVLGTTTAMSFVLHHTAGGGSADDVITTFNTRGLPAQYIIDRGGKIYRFMPDGAKGWQIGAKDQTSLAVSKGLTNSTTIGVEIIAVNDKDVLDIQVQAAARLAHYLGFSKADVYTHGQLNTGKQPTEGKKAFDYINNL